MGNQEIVHLFRNIAAAYAVKDEKKYRFQIIAYQKAADAVEHNSTELKTLYDQNRLEKIPGIGPTIKERLDELFQTGRVKHYEEVLKGVSPAVFPLLDIPSFGPKKANKLVEHFKLKDPKTVIEDVKKLSVNNRIAELEGFGEKSQADILRAIEEYKTGTTKTDRMVLPYAFELSKEILEYLKKSKDVIEVQPLGSLRRMVSTVGDIDIAVTTKNAEKVLQYFVDFPPKERIIEKGPTTASILIGGGKHVDLLVLPPSQWGSLLQHFTGSKHHNVALREYSLKKSLSLSERGIKLQKKKNKLVEFNNEEKFYRFLEMDWIPPELRENQGEIEAAINHNLPKLIELKDIKGDLHIHSNYQIDSSHDYGNASMEDMLKRAHELKYEYLGFSEHNPSITDRKSSGILNILKKRKDKIDKLKSSNKFGVRVINLLEVDILASGNLALNDAELNLIDAAIVSIHSSFNTPKDKMTARVLSGLTHPKAKILAHPTGRLINARAGYELDWDIVFDFCAKNNKAIEINAWPERLDLPDTLVRQAKDGGVKFIINTDSHAVLHMDNMFYGVSVARRGWCTKENVLNALPYEKLFKWITSES
jgi:DNA polymerase (family X)